MEIQQLEAQGSSGKLGKHGRGLAGPHKANLTGPGHPYPGAGSEGSILQLPPATWGASDADVITATWCLCFGNCFILHGI